MDTTNATVYKIDCILQIYFLNTNYNSIICSASYRDFHHVLYELCKLLIFTRVRTKDLQDFAVPTVMLSCVYQNHVFTAFLHLYELC